MFVFRHLQVIDMPEHNPGQMGGTMRLGKRRTLFQTKNSVMSKSCPHRPRAQPRARLLRECLRWCWALGCLVLFLLEQFLSLPSRALLGRAEAGEAAARVLGRPRAVRLGRGLWLWASPE